MSDFTARYGICRGLPGASDAHTAPCVDLDPDTRICRMCTVGLAPRLIAVPSTTSTVRVVLLPEEVAEIARAQNEAQL